MFTLYSALLCTNTAFNIGNSNSNNNNNNNNNNNHNNNNNTNNNNIRFDDNMISALIYISPSASWVVHTTGAPVSTKSYSTDDSLEI